MPIARELVIAHYNGSVDWIHEVQSLFDKVTIYHKGPAPLDVPNAEVIVLPNVGREAHTYLTHMIRRYDSLADQTVFSQDGYSDKLSPWVFYRICQGDAVINHFSVDVPWEDSIVQHWPHYKGIPMVPMGCNQRVFFDRYILDSPGETVIPWLNGAYVTASREEIQCRPRSCYERLLHETGLSEHVNPESAYLMERSWYALWKKPVSECRRLVQR